jgi:hypothetical protein
MKDRKVNQVLSGGLYQWKGEDIRRMNMVEIIGTHGTMRPVETVLRIREEDKRE